MILMGVVNLTPDSFRPETRAMSLEAAKARIADLVARGCSIIDFGAVSTRPGAADVPVEEEWRRLEPVLRHVRRMGIPSPTALIAAADNAPPLWEHPSNPRLPGAPFDGPLPLSRGWRRSCEGIPSSDPTVTGSRLPAISIDTTSAEIVRRMEALIGRFLVNDISAGEDDPAMLETVAELGLPYVAMHKRGNPRSMDALTDYPQGVVKAVDEYFEVFAAKAEALGIKDWILDPGFGFAKTAEQNWELLENLPALRHFGRSILVGVADKRFTHTPNPFVSTVRPDFVETAGSDYAERLAAERGADILRIH